MRGAQHGERGTNKASLFSRPLSSRGVRARYKIGALFFPLSPIPQNDLCAFFVCVGGARGAALETLLCFSVWCLFVSLEARAAYTEAEERCRVWAVECSPQVHVVGAPLAAHTPNQPPFSLFWLALKDYATPKKPSLPQRHRRFLAPRLSWHCCASRSLSSWHAGGGRLRAWLCGEMCAALRERQSSFFAAHDFGAFPALPPITQPPMLCFFVRAAARCSKSLGASAVAARCCVHTRCEKTFLIVCF